jgi:ketosteroid isomerase-like protein
MKHYIVFLSMLLAFATSFAQEPDEKQISRILDEQISSWNNGDLDSFMRGYWKSDSLMFVGKSGVTYGYDNTLARYRMGYPDTASMGKLKFNIITIKRISPEYFFVVGKYTLFRTIGDASGHYTLLIRKIEGEWRIVCDHSS